MLAARSGPKDARGVRKVPGTLSKSRLLRCQVPSLYTQLLANGSQDTRHHTLLLASIPLHQDRLAFGGAGHRVQGSPLGSRKLWPGASRL